MSLGLLVEQRKVEMCQRDRAKEGEREGGRERSGKEDDSLCASDGRD